jgi:hypothetical protein
MLDVVCVEKFLFIIRRLRYSLFVDLGQKLVVTEERVFILADLDGAAAELSWG